MPVIANQKKPDHLYCPPDALHPAAAALHAGLPYHPPLNGNTLRHTLEEFRAHHQACAVRRRHGLEYELRVEAQRTEWLTRKFMDGVRQQQPAASSSSSSSGGQQQGQQGQGAAGSGGNSNSSSMQQRSQSTTSEGANATSSEDTVTVKQQPPPSPDGLLAALTGRTMDTSKQVSNGNANSSKHHPQHHQHHSTTTSSHGPSTTAVAASAHTGGSQLGECPELGTSGTIGGLQRQASNGRSSKQAAHSLTLNLSNGTGAGGGSSALNKTVKNCSTNGIDSSKVFVKKEPDSLEMGGNRHCNRSPTTSTTSGRRLSLTGKDGKKSQRLSTSQKSSDKMIRSFSMSEDLEDDLKLSAADCMGGVISTPPIKPLEEGDDLITTPSPPTSAGILGSSKSASSVGSRSGSAAENVNFTGASATTHSTTSTTSAGQVTSPMNNPGQPELSKKPGGNSKDSSASSSLMQELNDFSKILDEVEMEQRANERFVLNQPPPPTDVFRGSGQSRDIVTTPHIARPTHLLSPPPYYAATVPKQATQQYYSPNGRPSYVGTPTVPLGGSSVQDPSLYIGVDYQQQSLSHQQRQHMTSTRVDPATFAPQPDQMHSEHMQRHPHISSGSPQVNQQAPPPPPSLGQNRPVLVSPTVRLPLPPHTPISSQMPPFPDPAVSSVTTPTMPPHTPTTPLEHFNTFPTSHPPPPQHPTPSAQIQSPTHPQYVPTPAGTVPISSTAFSFAAAANQKAVQDQLRSPTVTSAVFNWQANSLRDKMLAQVNSQIEARLGGGQKRLSQEAGFPLPPPTKIVAATGPGPSPFPHPQISGHNHMTTLRPPTPHGQQQQQQQPQPPQYLQGTTPTSLGGGPPIGYTGPTQHQPQLAHTISYQGPGSRLTSAPAYSHHHL